MNRKYEVIYILNPVAGDEAVNQTMERIQALIEEHGTIEQVDVWGRRRLAYEIEDQKEGHYVRIEFDANVEFPKELERVLQITEGVLRYLVVRIGD